MKWLGQWQRSHGTAAEFIALPAVQAVPLPDEVSFEVGATLGIPGLTAVQTVFGGGDVAGQTILISGGALRGAGDTRWIMFTSITVHWLMLVAQYAVIVVYEQPPLVSWWVFVLMLITLAMLYLGRLLGGRWRQPERLARVMVE